MNFEYLKQQLNNLLQSEMDESKFLEAICQLLQENIKNDNFNQGSIEFHKLVNDSFNSKLKNDILITQIDTGFSKFNKLSGGFYFGDFIMLAGRPSMGTTQFMVNLALNFSKTFKSLFLSYDLSRLLIQERFVSCLTKLPLYKLIDNNREDGIKKFNEIQLDTIKQKIYISDKGNDSLEQLEEIIENHIIENGVKIIFIDKIQKLIGNVSLSEKRNKVNLICNKLKKISQKHHILIIASGNVSKSAEFRSGPRKPFLEDLEYGEIIESIADKIILLYQPNYYGIIENEIGEPIEFQLELKIVKNNRGRIDSSFIYRDDYFTCFIEDEYRGQFDDIKKILSSLDNIHFNKNGYLKYL